MITKYVPEPDLSTRLSNGDETAFRIVFDRFHLKIHQFAYNFLKNKDLSEEVVQDTFLQFWLHRQTLDPNQAIAPYLFTIARRILIDTWRKAASSDQYRKEIKAIFAFSHNETEEQILLEDLKRITQEAFRQMSSQQRQVFILSRDRGLSYEEIAKQLHISKNTVKYHLVNALKIMRACFSKHDVLWLYFFYFLTTQVLDSSVFYYIKDL